MWVCVCLCDQCDYRTSRKMHFLRHVKDVHRQWRPYLCHHCGKAFKRRDALKQHSTLHAPASADATAAAAAAAATDAVDVAAAAAADATDATDAVDAAATAEPRRFRCHLCAKVCRSQAHLKGSQSIDSNRLSVVSVGQPVGEGACPTLSRCSTSQKLIAKASANFSGQLMTTRAESSSCAES